MRLRFEVAGRVVLAVRDDDPRVEPLVRSELDPYLPVDGDGGGEPDVLLERAPRPALDELLNAAGDGIVTGADARHGYLLVSGRTCSFPASARGPAAFAYEAGFPLGNVFRRAVRPALQLACLEHDAAAIHGAAVETAAGAVVVAGWSESGKTETALALVEDGARFLSDKWTIVSADGTAAAFPISVGIRRWVLRFLPQLRAGLPRAAATQLRLAGVTRGMVRPARAFRALGRAGEVLAGAVEQAATLADRASLRPSQVATAYGQTLDPTSRPQLHAVALLTTVRSADVDVRDVDARWAARRLARSATFERRAYFELHQRLRYTHVSRTDDPAREVEEQEERFLREGLARVRLAEVRAPFPTDPRRVADAIARHLG